MTDLPDAETAWEAWQPKPERHWTVARAAFAAGFAAASGPWAEQLDAANAERDECDHDSHAGITAGQGMRECLMCGFRWTCLHDAPTTDAKLRADLDAALARNAELEAGRRHDRADLTAHRVKASKAEAELDNLRETLAQKIEAIQIPAHWTLDGRQGFHECRNTAAAIVRGSDDE